VAYVRQLLKDDKAAKLDSFKDIPWAKKKGAEEEDVVDSKMTKKKMDVGNGPSNVGPTNLGPVAPPAIDAPATPKSSRYSLEGSTYITQIWVFFSLFIGGLVGGRSIIYFVFNGNIDPLFFCYVNLVLVGKSSFSPCFP
jgi:hypothetical protein